MKKLFFALLVLASLGAQAQPKIYITPVQITVGNEAQSPHGIRAVGGTAYGGPEYNENRNVVRYQESLSPGEALSFDIINQNNMYVIGLAQGTSQTNVYSTPVGNIQMIFGMTVGNSAKASVYEKGYIITSSTIASNNVLQISYEGNKIRYKKSTNGGTSFSQFYESSTTASGSYTIYFEAPPQYAGPHNIYKTGQVTNQGPTVSAGPDQAVSLPASQATLTSSASDADGTISSRLWEKVSGPAGGAISTPAQATTLVTGLTAGTYVYRFTATDDKGASAQDEASVVVTAADPGGSTTLDFPIIPFSDPEFQRRGGGSEQWFDQYYVNIPTEASRQPLDAVYWRFAWKEIETGDGIFRWATLEDEIRRAIDAHQVLSFGIMTQTASANWRTGVQMDTDQGVVMYYPFYLHRLMQSESQNSRDYIRHDGGEWVPNYNSPNFLARTRRLNDSIYAWLGRTTYKGVRFKDVINYVDIRHVGEWGEWHYNATAPDSTYWPAGRQPSVASYKAILDAYADAYPDMKTVVNFSVYDGRQLPNTWIPEEVGYYALTKRNAWGLIGWRRDQWGFADNGATYVRSWTDQNVNTYGGIRFDTVIMDRHNFAPVVGEPPGNWDNGDNPYQKNLPTEVRRYHPMSFGNGNLWTSPMYRPDLLTQGTRDSVRLASKLAGARLQIDSLVMSSQVSQGGVIQVKAWWRNAGVCPVYDVYLVRLMVKDGSGQAVINQESVFRPKLFRSSTVATMFLDQLQVPLDLPTGTYSLEMVILDSLGYRAPLAIANKGRQADGSYKLRGSFQIGEACVDCQAMRKSRNAWRTGFWVAVALLLIIPLLAAGLKLKISRRK